ncbi:transcriptional regulator PocR [Acerihabitans arboris]|uniref:AraC family transcriptional regulator n=1 Tax=Acerihabitans arboris TaxID=2691583 RepID=A0A845SH47_9GAMM|nr:PocR ligand-binding domain-containing protein [Acerihabitans arboris]NDL63189.1 AraC family transcriptional regulator [Acerihabitans arboris]
MNSGSFMDSELINKIAQDFANATNLAVVVVNIHGEEVSDLYHFTPFCQLMRQDPEMGRRCRMSDRCGGLEASKSNQPCIYRCHAGLTDFSIPLVIGGHLVGFVLCGQVRLNDAVKLPEVQECSSFVWQQNFQLAENFEKIPVIDYDRLLSSADLLKIIVDNYLKQQLDFVVIKEHAPASNERRAAIPSQHDSKMKKVLRYIDSHYSEDLRLEDVAAMVYLSPYYFSKLFKKYQGIGFNAYVNQQRMHSARQMLEQSDWSISVIARNLGFSQASYFCKVFRQAYRITPQAYREQRLTSPNSGPANNIALPHN